MMKIAHSPGGLNPDNGFSPIFVSASTNLGRYDDYAKAALAISNRFPVEVHKTVLDVCCGPGHFASSLCDIGYNVCGIDLSAAQINKAKEVHNCPRFEVGDMASLPVAKYDLITNVYTSFGYLESKKADFSLLRHWASRLKSGGGFVFELADMEKARNRIPKTGKLTRKNNKIVEHLDFNWNTNILTVEYIVNESQSWTCYTRIYEREELIRELTFAGFGDIQCFGSFDRKIKESDDNLVIYAVKK